MMNMAPKFLRSSHLRDFRNNCTHIVILYSLKKPRAAAGAPCIIPILRTVQKPASSFVELVALGTRRVCCWLLLALLGRYSLRCPWRYRWSCWLNCWRGGTRRGNAWEMQLWCAMARNWCLDPSAAVINAIRTALATSLELAQLERGFTECVQQFVPKKPHP